MRVWRKSQRISPLSPRRLAWLLLPGLALPPAVAVAQAIGANTTAQSDANGAGKYLDVCAKGNTKYAARDFQGAIASYRSAIEFDPKNPLGYYLLGEAQLAAGSIAEAEASWSRASANASEKDPALRARILFVIADLKERQWKWDEARAAWQAYLDLASRFPNVAGFPASARSRQQVIDAMVKQDKAYDIVRRRIAETKDGGVFNDLSKSP